jgi:hypothetical protein
VAERSKERFTKPTQDQTLSRVQIPPSPPLPRVTSAQKAKQSNRGCREASERSYSCTTFNVSHAPSHA